MGAKNYNVGNLTATGTLGVAGTAVVSGTGTAQVIGTFTGNYGHTYLDLTNSVTDGDTAIRLDVGGTDWIIGVEDGASDQLVIGTGSTINSAQKITVSTAGLMTLVGDLLVGGNIGITADADLLTLAANLLTVTGGASVGDVATNYTAFATDGLMTMAGTARVKKEFTIPLSDFNPGATGPTPALCGLFPAQSFGIDEDMHTSFEIPSDCDTSVDVKIEIYWAINEAYATNSGEVQWQAEYRSVAVGESVDNGGATSVVDSGDINIPATAYTLAKTELTISAASISQDDLVAINLARIDIDTGTDPTAEPCVVMVNLEYTSNKLGEAT